MSFILAINAGSSSLKFALYDNEEARADAHARPHYVGQVQGIGSRPEIALKGPDGARIDLGGLAAGLGVITDAAGAVPAMFEALAAAGVDHGAVEFTSHRLVHGGAIFTAPVVVDDGIVTELQKLTALAPLHNPAGVGALGRVRELLPRAVHVACFDTAFHAAQPDVATRLPLPKAWRDKGYRRYGFHGLNYEHVVDALPGISGAPLPSRLIVFHLGNGSSAAAIRDGRCVASTMGYSPLDGLIMGTRTGALDPGVVLAMLAEPDTTFADVERVLWRESGLKGLSGGTSDMRALLARDDAEARAAVESFCFAAAYHAGGLASTLGGVDAIVFTGGIGENAAPVRAGIVARLAWLGAAIAAVPNPANPALLSTDDSRVAIWRVVADEERILVRHAVRLRRAT
ncbi:MAG TPA: acetate kinase [Hyphomicrobiaceae bacterium]|nr:acetate kinase [Hyphomicrobiaceae bacterium]